MTMPIFAAIEAGGTKFNLAVGYDVNNPLCCLRIPTTGPAQTLNECMRFIREAQTKFGKISALGIASFGPVSLDPESNHYGTILNSPKAQWSNTNLVEYFSRYLKCPIVVDSDVNAAALAEFKSSPGHGNLAYITVGTGVGVGVCLNGKTLKGKLHPELGHLPIANLAGESASLCPAHTSCVEGLVSGPALAKRWGVCLEDVDATHPLWASSAVYLAQLCSAVALAYSPYRIILGGGVVNSGYLLGPVKREFSNVMGDYLNPFYSEGIEALIRAPHFKQSAGLAGAFYIGIEKYHDTQH